VLLSINDGADMTSGTANRAKLVARFQGRINGTAIHTTDLDAARRAQKRHDQRERDAAGGREAEGPGWTAGATE
jgi:hypothetical protein